MRLTQSRIDIGDIPQAKRNRVNIDGAGRHRQAFRIADDKVQTAQITPVQRPVTADAHHGFVNIGQGDMRCLARRIQIAEGDIPGAARNIQQMAAGAGADHADQFRLPQPMHPGAHHVVHQVIAAGHAVEHFADQRLLLGAFDFPKSEGHRFHGAHPLLPLTDCVRTIAQPRGGWQTCGSADLRCKRVSVTPAFA